MVEHYIGERLSFDRQACTVRYIGPVGQSTTVWLGVEWDDPSRGKHDGSHEGKRYLQCRKSGATTASFIKASRQADSTRTILDAIKHKYLLSTQDENELQVPTIISGKVVEELGYSKINEQLASLESLKVVVLDGLQIKDIQTPDSNEGHSADLARSCPNIRTLSLAGNLLESLDAVQTILNCFPYLEELDLSRNEFIESRHHQTTLRKWSHGGLRKLVLDTTYIPIEEVFTLTQGLPSLEELSLNENDIGSIPDLRSSLAVSSLSLRNNVLSDLGSLKPLKDSAVSRLDLRGNSMTLKADGEINFPKIAQLDISKSKLAIGLEALSAINDAFPNLLGLVWSAGGVPGEPETVMLLAVARLAKVKTINYSAVTDDVRTNAELYYLKTIREELAKPDNRTREEILKVHPRWRELRKKWQQEESEAAPTSKLEDPDSIESRMVALNFEFVRKDRKHPHGIRNCLTVPNTIKADFLYALIVRATKVWMHRINLVWVTDEFEPPEGTRNNFVGIHPRWDRDPEVPLDVAPEHDERWIVPGLDEDDDGGVVEEPMVRREVTIPMDIKPLNFWFEDLKSVNIRVELDLKSDAELGLKD